MICSYCKSDSIFLKETEDKTGVYCRNCGRWLKWVESAEKEKIKKEIDRQKREVKIDGTDVDRMMENLRGYKKKYAALTEEIRFFQERAAKSKSSEIEAKAMYEKALKLKVLTAKIAAYDEIMMILRLR